MLKEAEKKATLLESLIVKIGKLFSPIELSFQEKVLNDVLNIIKFQDNAAQASSNIKLINSKIDSIFKSDANFEKNVIELIEEIYKAEQYTKTYFAKASEVSKDEIERLHNSQLRNLNNNLGIIQTDKGLKLSNDNYFKTTLASVKDSLKNILGLNITANLSKDVIANTINTKINYELQRNFKDKTTQEVRSITQNIANEIGLNEFYIYAGSIQPTSRKFCKERRGKVFHKSEIDKWKRQKWEGKYPNYPNYNPYIHVGGVPNCGHLLNPVSEAFARQQRGDKVIDELLGV